jgi:hypothetical protein
MYVMSANSPTRRSLLAFWLLAAAFYVPLVLLSRVYVLPGVTVFNLAALLPATIALILVYREDGAAGARKLLARSFDGGRVHPRTWWLPTLLLYPSIVAVQCAIAFVSGQRVPAPHFTVWIPVIFLIVLVAALGEELGWMGYVFEPLQDRFGALRAAALLGVVWALIHIPLFSASTASIRWITWQCVYIGITRILFVWVYNNSGRSLSAVTLMHATFNIGWLAFPPSGGLLVPSFYDPFKLALTAMLVVLAVAFLWGPSTLAQFRCESSASVTKAEDE